VFLGSLAGLTFYSVAHNPASRVNVIGGATTSIFFARELLYATATDCPSAAIRTREAPPDLVYGCIHCAAALFFRRRFSRCVDCCEMALAGGPMLIALAMGHALTAVAAPDTADA
jgi:hypothetical protein